MGSYNLNQLAAWLIGGALASLALTALPARAVTGFTGSFSFDNAPSDPGTYWLPNTKCDFIDIEDNCVFVENTPEGANAQATFLPDDIQPSSSWTWYNKTDLNYYVSFDGDFVAFIPGNSVQILIGNSPIVNPDPGDWSDSLSNLRISPGSSLTFTINGNTGSDLVINNFNYSVPGPLPAAGAATAFGYSRRLRRRVKGQRLKGSCPPLRPAHPSAYLNLTPSALKSVPVSFSYASRPVRANQSQQAA